MLALALVLALWGSPDDPQSADRERVAALVQELKQSFAGADVEAKLAAVRRATELPDAGVVEALAKGLKEERKVQEATLEALRYLDHPAALSALHDAYKKDKELRKDEALLPQLLKAIGQHANPASIELLIDAPFQPASRPAIEARILGLGRIRAERSVEELMALMQLVGRAKSFEYMDEFRLALMVLTGVDRGRSTDAWIAWWNDSKKSFEIPASAAPLPEKEQARWNAYWGLAHEAGRQKRREERGNDGQGG